MNTTVASVRITWSRIMRRLNEAMAARAQAADGQRAQLDEPPSLEPEPPLGRPEPAYRPTSGRPPQLTPLDRFRLLWWRYRQPAIAFCASVSTCVPICTGPTNSVTRNAKPIT